MIRRGDAVWTLLVAASAGSRLTDILRGNAHGSDLAIAAAAFVIALPLTISFALKFPKRDD